MRRPIIGWPPNISDDGDCAKPRLRPRVDNGRGSGGGGSAEIIRNALYTIGCFAVTAIVVLALYSM